MMIMIIHDTGALKRWDDSSDADDPDYDEDYCDENDDDGD